ncbi:MAG: hypothetical protein WCO25_02695 [Candidatus Uhrbacteria bacterium]
MKFGRILLLTALVLVASLGAKFAMDARSKTVAIREPDAVQAVIDARLASRVVETSDTEIGDRVSVLLIGLDARAGSDVAHCDVIQLVEIDAAQQTVRITAVPRGTYSPLPPGGNYIPGDYYVSNACGIGGLEFGIAQIEKILGKHADHLAVVGFSETLGAFRLLGLPTTETLQWLRVRQPYAIGEPQRAHNHSTFIRRAMAEYAPVVSRLFATPVGYVFYNLVETDLTYAETRTLLGALADMDLANHPERVSLAMVPAYEFIDVPYDPETLDTALDTPFNPADGPSKDEAQRALIDFVTAGIDDPAFAERAFSQRVWLQIDDAETRESMHFALLSKRFAQLESEEGRQALVADYIIEMEAFDLLDWAEKGRELLAAPIE